MYEVIFDVTETLQNGNERRVKKSVLMPRFDANTKKHIDLDTRIMRGYSALAEANYYNIEYVETKNKTLIFGWREIVMNNRNYWQEAAELIQKIIFTTITSAAFMILLCL